MTKNSGPAATATNPTVTEKKGKPLSQKKGGVKRFFAALRSLKFTVVLIAYMIVTGALSTFIPQGMEPEFYFAHYSPGLARLVVNTGFTHFFSSPGFLIPVGLFFINLLACTVFRFTRELKKKGRRNFGPDILHGGLILFMIASVFSVYGRMHGSATLAAGDSVILPNGNLLILDHFEYRKYEDGRPQAWISYVTVIQGGETLYSAHPIEVNHPLKLDNFSLYQVSYGSIEDKDYSVLRAVEDPGYTFVVISLIITGAGIFIAFIPKIRKKPHD